MFIEKSESDNGDDNLWTNTSHLLSLLRGFIWIDSIDIPKRGEAEFLGFRSASFRAANLTLATFRPICHEWKSSCSQQFARTE